MAGVTNHIKRYISKLSDKKRVFFVILISVVILFPGCNSNKENADIRIAFTNSTSLATKWDEAFGEHKIIPFFMGSVDKELYTIGWMAINSKGDYFIADGKIRQIYQFDPAGKLVRNIGRQGHGPGEYDLPRFPFFDEKDNLYFFDSGTRKVSKYSFPGYQYEGAFDLGRSAQDLYRDHDGNFIIYSLYSLEYNDVLLKVGSDGKILRTAYTPKFKNFRIFICRFQIGGFGFPNQEEDILFLYPYDYKIHLYDRLLNLKKVFYSSRPSSFTPEGMPFPQNLNPYHYSPKISKWWGEQLHPIALFGFGNGLFLVELGKYDNLDTKSYANIHGLDGTTFAEGLEVPHSLIKYSKDGFIYIVEDSSFDEDGNVTPLRLHRYKLKSRFKK